VVVVLRLDVGHDADVANLGQVRLQVNRHEGSTFHLCSVPGCQGLCSGRPDFRAQGTAVRPCPHWVQELVRVTNGN